LLRMTSDKVKVGGRAHHWQFRLFVVATLLCASGIVSAQQDAAKAAVQSPTIATEDLRPVADGLGATISNINVSKWKAPGEIKGQAQADIASIQRNLKTTLPELLDQAHAAPGNVAPAFAVYRNVSALYDVLLRVAETATLAGPQQDGAALEDQLRKLESARKAFGASLLDAATARDSEVLQLRTSSAQLTAQLAALQAPAKKVVVNDNPSATAAKKKKKPVTPPAAPPAQ
jgi:hypothetical protein